MCLSVSAQDALLSSHETYVLLQSDAGARRVPSWSHYERLLQESKHFSLARQVRERRQQMMRPKPAQTERKGDESAAAVAAAAEMPEPERHTARASLRSSMVAGRSSLPELRPIADTVWIRSEALAYLREQPCSVQSRDHLQQFMAALSALLQRESLKLTIQEIQLLVDLRPDTLVEIHSIIDECEERMSQEQTQALLALVKDYLPTGSAAENDAAAAAARPLASTAAASPPEAGGASAEPAAASSADMDAVSTSSAAAAAPNT
jgi:DNA-directed RNA polymerase subunit F